MVGAIAGFGEGFIWVAGFVPGELSSRGFEVFFERGFYGLIF